jgi:hypothetical protein
MIFRSSDQSGHVTARIVRPRHKYEGAPHILKHAFKASYDFGKFP